jgi:hypothetical protein
MTTKEIQRQRDFFYRAIKEATEGLKELREQCPHADTFEGLYEYRIGATHPATMCKNCGACVKLHSLTYQY